MDKKESTENWIARAYNKLTAPQTIKICGFAVMAFYIGLLLIGVLIAATLHPGGYTVWDNWISDLGSIEHTPAPYLYDIACAAAGILSMPFIFYQEKHIAPIPRTPEDLPAPNRMTYRGIGLAFFFTLLGNFFYIFVGIFSGDRNYYDLHNIFSYLTFGFYAFGTLFFGFTLMVARQKLVPRPWNFIIGPIGMVAPFTVAILNVIDSTPLREWGLLWAIMGFVIPVVLFTLRHAGKLEQEGSK